jgi:hypothetical protein
MTSRLRFHGKPLFLSNALSSIVHHIKTLPIPEHQIGVSNELLSNSDTLDSERALSQKRARSKTIDFNKKRHNKVV